MTFIGLGLIKPSRIPHFFLAVQTFALLLAGVNTVYPHALVVVAQHMCALRAAYKCCDVKFTRGIIYPRAAIK